MPAISPAARKKATGQAPPTWVPIRRRLYLQADLYRAAMRRVRARQYPSLAAFIQFAVQEHLAELVRDERRAAGQRVYGADGLAERDTRRRAFLNRRADEIFAVYEKQNQPAGRDARPDLLTSAATPSADDDLFALNPLLSADEQAALEAIGDWIPDFFADEPQPDDHGDPTSASQCETPGRPGRRGGPPRTHFACEASGRPRLRRGRPIRQATEDQVTAPKPRRRGPNQMLHARVDQDVYRRLKAYTSRLRVEQGAVVSAALAEHLDKSSDMALVLRRLDRLTRSLGRLQRELDAMSEFSALSVQVWFAHTPALPVEARKAAQHSANQRFAEMIAYLRRRMAGPKRILVDLLGPEQDDDRQAGRRSIPAPSAPRGEADAGGE